MTDAGAGLTPEPRLVQEQLQREKAQRDMALGKRIEALKAGRFGPIVKRWVNASIEPTARRLREAAKAYIAKDYPKFASILDAPSFQLGVEANAYLQGDTSLETIMRWLCRGGSPGRSDKDATYADDLVLAGMGAIILLLAQRQTKDGPRVMLTTALSNAATAMRECALGQWITLAQGADTLAHIRDKKEDHAGWRQRRRMNRVAGMMMAQVQPILEAAERGEIDLSMSGTRAVLQVHLPWDQSQQRQVTVFKRALTAEEWLMLRCIWKEPQSAHDPQADLWFTLALMVVCCAQFELGWFDLAREKQGKGLKRKAHVLMLSGDAQRALALDADRWLQAGFVNRPMLVPPKDWGYLSVKLPLVTGGMGPMGMRTEMEGTAHFDIAQRVMASTKWEVNKDILSLVSDKDGPQYAFALKACDGNELLCDTIISAYKQEAGAPFYIPIYADFRGRLYPRTTWVTYQGNDLQKALLRFVYKDHPPEITTKINRAWVLHMRARWGNGVEKRPLEFFDNIASRDWKDAEEPLQYLAGLLDCAWNQLPLQMDGTCNGLQHLAALFRDEQAAPYVNLTRSTYEDAPGDIYGRVAEALNEKIILRCTFQGRHLGGAKMAGRLNRTNVPIDRKLCKKPVMVLPYGGTLASIEEAVLERVAETTLDPSVWLECKCLSTRTGLLVEDTAATEGGYMAFKDRPLKEHPLFRRDMHDLAVLLWETIRETIPSAMAAMDFFKAIAGKVGSDVLEWNLRDMRSSKSCPLPPDLWVVHAYPKSAAQSLRLKGLHFSGEIRGLQMRKGRDEVDPHKHQTGIVANFIHSLDANHLVRTMALLPPETSFGVIHDCYLCRPSDYENVYWAARNAFKELYLQDPLAQPTRLTSLKTGLIREYDSWYTLAKELGVPVPKKGCYDPAEVTQSVWFFS